MDYGEKKIKSGVNKRLREFFGKALLLFVILCALVGFVCFLLFQSQESLAKSNYETGAKFKAVQDAAYVGSILDDYYLLAKSNEVDAFDFYGEIADGITLSIDDDSVIFQHTIRDYLIRDGISFYTLKSISNDTYTGALDSEEDCAVFSVKTGELSAKLYFVRAQTLIGRIKTANFNEYAIYDGLGHSRMHVGAPQEKISELNFSETETKFVDIDFGGEKYLLVSEKMDTEAADVFYFSGAISFSECQKQIQDTIMGSIIVLVLCSVVLMGLYLSFAFWLTKTQSFFEKISVRNGFVLVYVTQSGDVIRSGKNYAENFERCNIFDKIVARSDTKQFKAGDSFLASLEDKDGNKHLISFFILSVAGTVKLMGQKVDEIMHMEGLATDIGDAESIKNELQNQFHKLQESETRVLFGLFQINNLKNLEAMFGKEFSEKLFMNISQKLKKTFESIYALPGELIGVLIGGESNVKEYFDDMKEIMTEINHPLLINGNLVNVGCKAGFSVMDSVLKEVDFDYVYRCAKAGLKRALSEKGEQDYYIFHESQKKLYVKYLDYNYDIEQMLEHNSFELEYQPQYSLKKDVVVGFEALFRVKKTLELEINVFELIQYAERTGRMILLGDYIFNEGMKFAKSIEGQKVSVSLNVSPIQFMQSGFVENFLNIYRQHDLKPGSVSVEITESFLMTNFDEVLKKLEILRENGIGVHLDDFGTAYSSFLYLKKLPITAIKIDREFVKDIIKNDYSKTITEIVVHLTKDLNLVSIVEGIETKEQAMIVKKYGADVIQGYLIGRSMPADNARALIQRSKEIKLLNE